MRDFPLVILTGHRKSGTSLFHRLFDGVKSVNTYPTDLTVLYAYFSCFTSQKEISNNSLKERLIQVLDKSLEYSLKQGLDLNIKKVFLKIVNNEINKIDLRLKSDVIFLICNSWLKANDMNSSNLPFIIKETSQAIFFESFLKYFPKLKMISIIRDPRDNYAAINEGIESYYSSIGENSLEALSSHINRARMDLISARINQNNFPKSFMAIRFEDLVKNPEKIMKIVSNFLNIEYEKGLISPNMSGKPYLGNNFDGKLFYGISSENIGQWKKRITSETTKVIEYWMADVMNDWGYVPEYEILNSQIEFSKFYEKYNCKYFYNDSFRKNK